MAATSRLRQSLSPRPSLWVRNWCLAACRFRIFSDGRELLGKAGRNKLKPQQTRHIKHHGFQIFMRFLHIPYMKPAQNGRSWVFWSNKQPAWCDSSAAAALAICQFHGSTSQDIPRFLCQTRSNLPDFWYNLQLSCFCFFQDHKKPGHMFPAMIFSKVAWQKRLGCPPPFHRTRLWPTFSMAHSSASWEMTCTKHQTSDGQNRNFHPKKSWPTLVIFVHI